MLFLTGLIIAASVIVFFRVLEKILKNIEKNIRRDIRENKLKYGYISRKDIAMLEPETGIRNFFLYRLLSANPVLLGVLPYSFVFKSSLEEEFCNFTKWCDRYMESMGHTNRRFVSGTQMISDKDISGSSYTGGIREVLFSYRQSQGDYETYVFCVFIKKDVSEQVDEDNWPELGIGAVQVLLGKMASDGIKNGVLITTGNFSAAACNFANSVKKPFKIDLLDGMEITKRHRVVVGMELRKLLGNN